MDCYIFDKILVRGFYVYKNIFTVNDLFEVKFIKFIKFIRCYVFNILSISSLKLSEFQIFENFSSLFFIGTKYY